MLQNVVDNDNKNLDEEECTMAGNSVSTQKKSFPKNVPVFIRKMMEENKIAHIKRKEIYDPEEDSYTFDFEWDGPRDGILFVGDPYIYRLYQTEVDDKGKVNLVPEASWDIHAPIKEALGVPLVPLVIDLSASNTPAAHHQCIMFLNGEIYER